MNQQINAPTSFVSFKKLDSAPTVPKKTASASPASASASINPMDYMVEKTTYIDYVPLAVGLGVVYMMVKY